MSAFSVLPSITAPVEEWIDAKLAFPTCELTTFKQPMANALVEKRVQLTVLGQAAVVLKLVKVEEGQRRDSLARLLAPSGASVLSAD